MLVTNVVDYMKAPNKTYYPFRIPNYWDTNIYFPYSMNESGVIVDSRGCPAIFTLDMLNNIDWEICKEP